MSSKIDVSEIIKGHLKSFKDNSGRIHKWDISTFYVLPALVAMCGMYRDFKLSPDFTSLLINFGSIFTALLLSVLMLIYEQENKLDDKKSLLDQQNLPNNIPFFDDKKKILHELYDNICYCVISATFIIVVASINSALNIKPITLGTWFEFDLNQYIFAPLCVFISLNVILTIFMIVKRMHALLMTR